MGVKKGKVAPHQIFAKVDLLAIENDTGKRKW